MTNNYGLFFSRGSTVLRLPINPEKLPVARETDNDEYNVLGIGPITVPRIPKEREVTISSFFPGRSAPYVLTSGGFEPPEFYIDFFTSAMNDKAPILYVPVRYYEDGTPFMTQDPGFQVLVMQFSTEERAGETGDFYYDLTLREYRDATPATVDISASSLTGPVSASVSKPREIPSDQLYVGCTCTVNGKFWNTSYGEPPYGNGNGRRCVVSRIIEDASRPDPIHINSTSGGPLGWTKKSSLQVVG